jgi:hypothetical protein
MMSFRPAVHKAEDDDRVDGAVAVHRADLNLFVPASLS